MKKIIAYQRRNIPWAEFIVLGNICIDLDTFDEYPLEWFTHNYYFEPIYSVFD